MPRRRHSIHNSDSFASEVPRVDTTIFTKHHTRILTTGRQRLVVTPDILDSCLEYPGSSLGRETSHVYQGLSGLP